MEKNLSLDYWKNPSLKRDILYSSTLWIGNKNKKEKISREFFFTIPVRIPSIEFIEEYYKNITKETNIISLVNSKIMEEKGRKEIVSLMKNNPKKWQWKWYYISLKVEGNKREFTKIPRILHNSKLLKKVTYIHLIWKNDAKVKTILKDYKIYKFRKWKVNEVYENYPKFLTSLTTLNTSASYHYWKNFDKAEFKIYLGQELGLIPK